MRCRGGGSRGKWERGGQGEGDRGAGLLGGGGGWGGGGGEEGQHFLFPGKVFGAQKA